MNEYYDYDEALKVNRERKRKAAALKRKRQAQIRLIKRNILCAVILVALTLLVIQFLRHIVPDISRRNELKQEMVLADTGNYDDVITVVQEKPTFRYALKSVMYKEMTDTDIQSPYIALLDATDNEFIAGKQINTRIYPASMTKVMSLIIAVENIKDLNETYKFGFDELNYLYIEQASVAGFSVDEEVKAKDLLYGLVLPSGADAAYGIARLAAGSQEAFVELMNEKCDELGLKNTHFCNPSGLHDENQYTTPAEMALIMKYAMSNEECAKVLETYQYTTEATPQHPQGISLTSTMFSRMYGNEVEGVTIKAGKTGYTDQAHNCLVNYAVKGDKEYVTVMAAAGNRWYVIFDGFKILERYLP